MKTTYDFLNFVMYSDMKFVKDYEVNLASDFYQERMKQISEFKWCAKSTSLYRFARLSLAEALSLQFLSRTEIATKYGISEYLGAKYKSLSEILQKVLEIEMYGLYNMKRAGKFVPDSLHAPIFKDAAGNVENDYWRKRFVNAEN